MPQDSGGGATEQRGARLVPPEDRLGSRRARGATKGVVDPRDWARARGWVGARREVTSRTLRRGQGGRNAQRGARRALWGFRGFTDEREEKGPKTRAHFLLGCIELYLCGVFALLRLSCARPVLCMLLALVVATLAQSLQQPFLNSKLDPQINRCRTARSPAAAQAAAAASCPAGGSRRSSPRRCAR